MRQETYIATYHKWECPYCGAMNMVDNGDISDITVLDVEEADCEKCGRTFGCGPGYEGE